MSDKTIKDYEEIMQWIAKMEDKELMHICMDNLMCEILNSQGYENIVKIFIHKLWNNEIKYKV
jgi:hypothetical protein